MPRKPLDRRTFLKSSALAISAGTLGTASAPRGPEILERRPHPVVVASANGSKACVPKAMELILAGKPVMDALVAGVNLVENDPDDMSVGYGGLPNEDGVVELDSSVMDGATCNAGAVAAIRDIKNPSLVALRVMRYTDHCLLVGEGAKRFALAHGFREENLLTDDARQIWLQWKSRLNKRDDWFPLPEDKLSERVRRAIRSWGTINCDGLDADGNLAGVTTTSGLSFKIPGRVGDSPIIGAGLYVDNRVGAAGSTGRGEANIITCGSATVVEGMRQKKHPKDACLYACQRIADMTTMKHLVRKDGRPDFNVKFYAVDKSGRHGGAAIWPGGVYAVFDKDGNRKEPLASLYE